MLSRTIAAVVYADGVYPDEAMVRAIAPMRDAGMALVGVLQRSPDGFADRHPCDLLIEDLASGEVVALAEHRGKEARGCRLDVGLLTDVGEAVLSSLRTDSPCLLVVNKFGKIEADGGGMRDAIAEAAALGIPVLVGVPARNLDRWRAFAGPLAVELAPRAEAIAGWLQVHGLTGNTESRMAAGPGLARLVSR